MSLWNLLSVKYFDSEKRFWKRLNLSEMKYAFLTNIRLSKIVFFGALLSFFPFQFLYAQLNASSNNFFVTTSELQHKIQEDIVKVVEFKVLRKEAQKRGVKLYLFGGTAAGFAHYSKVPASAGTVVTRTGAWKTAPSYLFPCILNKA